MEEEFKSGEVGLSRGVLRTGAVLHPTQPGAKKLARKYGEKLLCVRYRYDKSRKIRLITVELVEEVLPWTPRPAKKTRKDENVFVRVNWGEKEVALKIRDAGGRWMEKVKLWCLSRKKVVSLKLVDRIVPIAEKAPK